MLQTRSNNLAFGLGTEHPGCPRCDKDREIAMRVLSAIFDRIFGPSIAKRIVMEHTDGWKLLFDDRSVAILQLEKDTCPGFRFHVEWLGENLSQQLSALPATSLFRLNVEGLKSGRRFGEEEMTICIDQHGKAAIRDFGFRYQVPVNRRNVDKP